MPAALTFSGTPKEYIPASLRHDTNGWYIVYYEFNPIVSMLQRKRVRLNALRKNCHTQLEFRVQVDSVMKTINSKLIADLGTMHLLTSGNQMTEEAQELANISAMALATNPVAPAPTVEIPKNLKKTMTPQDDCSRYCTPIEDVIGIYLQEKERDTREATFRSYKSFCTTFKKWIKDHCPNCKCVLFNKPLAVEFLDFIESRDDISNRTYNNLMKMGRAFFSWAVKKCYCKINPFEGQETKRVLKKSRTIIPPEIIQQIDEWFAHNYPAMCIVMRLVYTSLLRPVEITRIQINQIDFKHHCIHMPCDKTKNWEARDARMDSELEEMISNHIIGAKPNAYLFGYGTWTPGTKQMNPNTYSKTWQIMRAHLLDANGNRIIPDEYQLYSLKDTAINGMIKSGVDDLSVMQAAGHKDLKMTQIYADHNDPELISKLNIEAPKFGEVNHRRLRPIQSSSLT